MTRVFVYEHLSGGGLHEADAPGAGELMAMGRAMRDAIAADLCGLSKLQATIACGPQSPLPVGVLPGLHTVRPEPGEAAFDFVRRQAQAHDLVWVVAPETGGLLAELRRAVGGERWLGCSAEAIEWTTRKRATLRRLAQASIATPLDFERDAALGRWVVKPDDGAGAIDTRVHDSAASARADLRERARTRRSASIEPWVEGEAMSLSLICRDDEVELLSVNRQQLTIGARGLLRFEGVEPVDWPSSDPRRPRLARLARQVHQALPGLHGFVGIDLVWHEQRGPVAIEVNPRITCAYVGLSKRLGRRLAAELVALGAAHPGASLSSLGGLHAAS